MDDDEYEALRAKRLAELQAKQGAGNKLSPEERQRVQQERAEKEDEMRNSILSQILSQEARARLNTIKTAKPEKAKMVEDILINNARMGLIGGKMTEEDLKGILEKVSQQFSRETKVKFDRRRAAIDSDDE